MPDGRDAVRLHVTSNFAPLLISQRVVDLLAAEDVSGWDTFPVEVRDKNGSGVGGYSGLVVTGRCGPIRDRLSEIINEIMPGGIVKRYKGWYFDLPTWDGSDIFVTEGGGVLRFVRERVRALFVRHKVRNAKLIKATEDIRPIFP